MAVPKKRHSKRVSKLKRAVWRHKLAIALNTFIYKKQQKSFNVHNYYTLKSLLITKATINSLNFYFIKKKISFF